MLCIHSYSVINVSSIITNIFPETTMSLYLKLIVIFWCALSMCETTNKKLKILFELLGGESKDVVCFDTTALGYYSYLQSKTIMHHWADFIWHLLQVQKIQQYSNNALKYIFLLLYFRWLIILYDEVFQKRSVWNRSFTMLQYFYIAVKAMQVLFWFV